MSELIYLWWIVILVLILVSALSLCFPVLLIRLSRFSGKRFNLPAENMLNTSISIDKKLYRHHVLSGALISGLSAVALYLLLFKLDLSRFSAQISSNPFAWQMWLFESVLTIALLGGVIGCCAGLVMMLRPSLLRPLEFWGNRWITTSKEMLEKDLSGDVIERWVIQHTRLFGLSVLLAAGLIWVLVFG